MADPPPHPDDVPGEDAAGGAGGDGSDAALPGKPEASVGALVAAAREGRSDDVVSLLLGGVDADALDESSGCTALMAAAASGDVEREC